MKYTVLHGPVLHNGQPYSDGAPISLSAVQAEPLIAAGVIGNPVAEDNAPEAAKPPEPEKSFAPVNLNTADNATLLALPHIGKGLASRIEKARPISSLEGLDQLLGLNAEQWAEVAALVTI